VTVLRLSAQALARSRFALSPLAETLGAMRVLLDPCTDPWVRPWHTEHAPTFRATHWTPTRSPTGSWVWRSPGSGYPAWSCTHQRAV